MGNPKGFLQIRRAKAPARPAAERLADWAEFETTLPPEALRDQASRCMDCGIPFCHKGCPLGNLIPDWNDLVYRGRLDEALEALESTNNFPEVTGRVCPAPCEASCVLNIDGAPVTIKEVERALGDHALGNLAPLRPRPPLALTGRTVAVVGSGPAGLAAAQQLARRGHAVTVFERDDRPGGLLRYGIPDFKLDKSLLDRRVEQMTAEGVTFRTGVNIGSDITGEGLLTRFDAIVLCVGAGRPRPLPVPGADLAGVHPAMAFLAQQNRRVAGDNVTDPILATGKHVVILGGGDTGSDCLGTSLRQGAASVVQLELMPRPPTQRPPTNPWPEWPQMLRTSSSQEEGGTRDFAVQTRQLLGDEQGRVRALQAVRVELVDGQLREIPGSTFELPCDLVLLAMGYTGVEPLPLLDQLGLALGPRGTLPSQASERIFAAGDAVRGASLVVWAIAEGRRIAEQVDQALRQGQQAAAQ